MRGLNKNLLEQQIEVYLACASNSSLFYREWLDKFCKWTHRTSVLEITEDDVDLFLEKVYSEENADYRSGQARLALNSFRRYYMARSKNGKLRMGRGRPQRTAEIEKVRELRALRVPLSFREIGRVLNADVRQIYRWYKHTKQ